MKKTNLLLRLVSAALIAVMLLVSCNAPSGDPVESDQLVKDLNSKSNLSYDNINGKTVGVYSFHIVTNEVQNNPNFPQAVMLYQAIRYKETHPDEEVYATVTSFHFSAVLAACLDVNSPDYGKMKNLYDADYTDDGYYRITYLCVEAAKKGINITVIGQIDASPVPWEDGGLKADHSFADYFNSHLNDAAYKEGKKVSDYMNFRESKWLSYGDKSATDMMHLKLCAVSNFTDNAGVDHGKAVWLGSINLDGVDHLGINQNNSVQAAVVITDHEEIYSALFNYVNILKDYCEQEDALTFRSLASRMATEQIDLIKAGRESEISKESRIVYLGSESDKVFRLYTTPFGGAGNTWNTDYNPYCAYVTELCKAAEDKTQPIEFIWNAPKYKQNFELGEMLMQAVASAFEKNGNASSRLHLNLPGVEPDTFLPVAAASSIGHLGINSSGVTYHSKDVHLSYVKNGVRHYVTLINTLNPHEGSMYYQSNLFLVIDETDETGNAFYAGYAARMVPSLSFETVEGKPKE